MSYTNDKYTSKNKRKNISFNTSIENQKEKINKMSDSDGNWNDGESEDYGKFLGSGSHNSTMINVAPEVIRTVNDLNSLEQPDPKDVMGAITKLMLLVGNTNSNVTDNGTEIKALRNEISTLKSDITALKTTRAEDLMAQDKINTKLSTNINSNRTEINYLKQLRVDNDIMITNIPAKPEKENVLNFCQYYKIPPTNITNFYTYQSKSASGDKFNLIVTFISKTAQISFRESKRTIGPITANNIITNKLPEKDNRQLKVFARLIPENVEIQKELRSLLSSNKIKGIRYRNCSFQIQLLDQGDYVAVPTMETLRNLLN